MKFKVITRKGNLKLTTLKFRIGVENQSGPEPIYYCCRPKQNTLFGGEVYSQTRIFFKGATVLVWTEYQWIKFQNLVIKLTKSLIMSEKRIKNSGAMVDTYYLKEP